MTMCIKILTYYNLYLYSYFFIFSLPSKFLTKPLRVLEDEVNKTNKQNKECLDFSPSPLNKKTRFFSYVFSKV